MAMWLGVLHTALLEAGASAGKAAKEGAGHVNRLTGIEARISALTWMAAANVGLAALALCGSVMLYGKLGEISG